LKTIKDIAKLANVSQSTVSKALNDKPDISQKTKEKILQIVKQHQYSPNAFAKSLKKRTTENIGVIFYRDIQPLSANPFYSRVLEGIEAEIDLNNFNLMLKIVTENSGQDLPKMVSERQVEGLILVGAFGEKFVSQLLNKNILLVFVDPRKPFEKQCQILIDNEHGAYTATQYLIRNGHKKIGFISGDLSRSSFKQRFDGYLKALRTNGIEVSENLIQTGGIEDGYQHVQNMLKKEKPTAIFAANDINAIYGYKAIKDLNLKIPEDISIVGFDDIDLSQIASPPLTTVRVYKEELGSIAVRTLIKMINKEIEHAVTTVVPTTLVERESVKKYSNQIKVQRR